MEIDLRGGDCWIHVCQQFQRNPANLSPVHTSNTVEATFDFVATNGNSIERVYRIISSFDKVECCFDIVAVFWQQCCRFRQHFGNNCERYFLLSTKSKQIEHSVCFDFVERTKFRSTLLPKAATLLPKTATMSK